VLTTEIKLNLLAPADGSHFLARGRVSQKRQDADDLPD